MRTLQQSSDGLFCLLVFILLPALRLCFFFYKKPEARVSLPLLLDFHGSIPDPHLSPSPLSLHTGASHFHSCPTKYVIHDPIPFCLIQSRSHD